MKTLFATTAAFAALMIIAPIDTAHAEAADFEKLVCDIQVGGDQLTYTFAPNTGTRSSGTYVETSFRRNGVTVVSHAGQRPIWVFGDTATGRDISSRANPGWTLSLFGKAVTLTHNGRAKGTGSCDAY